VVVVVVVVLLLLCSLLELWSSGRIGTERWLRCYRHWNCGEYSVL
jgi:hypothetical protein